MQLWVIRHAIAFPRVNPDCPPDPLRPLTERGRRRMQAAARGLQELGVTPIRSLTSPFIRAQETAEIVLDALQITRDSLEENTDLLPGADPIDLLNNLFLKNVDTAVFGHAPHLDRLIAAATNSSGDYTELKKGGTACLEFQGARDNTAILRWLMTPRSLRQIGGA